MSTGRALFITTEVYRTHPYYPDFLSSIKSSLRRLCTDYIDLCCCWLELKRAKLQAARRKLLPKLGAALDFFTVHLFLSISHAN